MTVTPVRVALAVSLLIGTSIGCRRQSGLEALLGSRALTPPPASAGLCDFNLEGGAAETVFFVLGMLSEYQGRGIVEDEDLVEGFYCDESSVAPVFRDAITKLANEQELDSSIRTVTTQDCLISFRSKQISDRLNSCYSYRASNERLAQGADGTYRRTASPTLGLQLFLRSGANTAPGGNLSEQAFHSNRALAYVAGAWARYGRGSEFIFANAQNKVKLVAQLLSFLGCQNVRLESDFGFIPQTHIIKFEATAEVRERLRMASK
jgi:hypothetical protein